MNFNGSNYNGAANLLVPLLLVKNRKKSTTNLSISNEFCLDNSIGNISTAAANSDHPNTNNNANSSNKPNSLLDSSTFQLSLSENELANSSLSIQNPHNGPLSSNSTANTSITLQSTLNNMNNNNNLLNVVSADQDQARRCSHDPNIEKLHKTFRNNVRLGVSNDASSHISSSSSLSQNIENHPLNTIIIDFDALTSAKQKKSTLNSIKKMSFKKLASKSASSSSPPPSDNNNPVSAASKATLGNATK